MLVQPQQAATVCELDLVLHTIGLSKRAQTLDPNQRPENSHEPLNLTLDLEYAHVSLPLDECRIPVLHDDLPFLERAALVLCPAVPLPPRTHLRAAIDKGAGISGGLEHRRDRRDGGTPPACLAIAASPRQRKPSLVERADDPNGGAALEKGVEYQSDPGLHLPIRGLGDDTGGIAHQPDRQWQGQLAAFGLGQQARR